tara:strand:- start:265 stop:441 length:177 start_codon:yes stop_codon:yes gene_type:complete
MYNFDEYDNKLREFETAVVIAVNMEISDKIGSEEAYQRIKSGYSRLKKFRKNEKKNAA